jgi:serine kinase of HPr protein (carbohydrate metabolism regulator)
MATTHATAVLAGPTAVLIRGPSGSGKSQLALDLLEAGRTGRLPFARLVGDDRVLLEAAHDRLLVRPAPGLEGLIEVRGAGLLRVPFEPLAVVGLVVDLGVAKAHRLPVRRTLPLHGISLPYLETGALTDPLLPVLARLSGNMQDV